MLTQRAVRCPPALPAAMDLLLLVLGGSEEAQALWVTTGGLEALLGATLEAAAPALGAPSSNVGGSEGGGGAGGASSSSSEQAAAEVLLMRLLVFLQLLQGWVLGEAVRRGEWDEAGITGVGPAGACLGVCWWWCAGACEGASTEANALVAVLFVTPPCVMGHMHVNEPTMSPAVCALHLPVVCVPQELTQALRRRPCSWCTNTWALLLL